MGWKNLNSKTRAEEMTEKVKLCHTQGSEGHEPPHAFKKLIAWPYDIGFYSSKRRIGAYNVGYIMQ